MKVQVIYSSLTGRTAKLANAIYQGLQGVDKSIHDLKDGIPQLDGDIILAGYWAMRGGPDEQAKAFLQTLEGKAVGLFCTLAYYPDSTHARQVLDGGLSIVKDKNQILGSFIANGAISQAMKDSAKTNSHLQPTEQKKLRWKLGETHPTDAECALAAERFRERVWLYGQCREKGIPCEQVL